jgi:deoxyribonuclease V
VDTQRRLASARPPAWRMGAEQIAVGAVWVCFPRGQTGAGHRGDPAWAAAVRFDGRRLAESAVVTGEAGAPYEPGLLALREGPVLEAAVLGLATNPDVLLLDATGRDHPRRAGLALHLGAVLDLPTVGVTDRPLLAAGSEPPDARDARAALTIDGEVVAARLRTRTGVRPVVVHPAWRTDLDTAVAVVVAASRGHRAPEPLRVARRLAREARSR